MMLLAFFLAICQAFARSDAPGHVRVVLDVSGSMAAESMDRTRIALMSTMLLRDLQQPDPNRGDSFAVVPFDTGHDWAWQPGGPPPGCDRPTRLESTRPADRDALAAAVRGLRYAGQHTWYTPCLRRALRDLPPTPPGSRARRVVVLLTDGLPADDRSWRPEDRESVLAAEKEQMRLAVTEARATGDVDVYILAVGQRAAEGLPWLREVGDQDAGGKPLARVLAARRVGELPERMMEVYGRSFGYGATKAAPDGEAFVADLGGGDAPDAVAVVALAPGGPLERPSSPGVALLESQEWRPDPAWGGYTLSWLDHPRAARVPVRAAGAREVFVLRPRTWMISPEGEPVREVIAGRSTPIRVVVQPAGGSAAIPNVRARAYLGDGAPKGPDPNLTTRSGNGTVFTFKVDWPATGTEVYRSEIRIEASPDDGFETTLAYGTFDVLVHPPVDLRLVYADPSGVDRPSARVGDSAIRDGGSASLDVHLRGAEALPDSLQSVPMQFVLGAPASAGVPGGQAPTAVIAETTFRLDGAANAAAPVGYAAATGPGKAGAAGEPRDWRDGVPMTREQLGEAFTLLVEARSRGEGGTVTVPLRAVLATPPYSHYPDLVAELDLTIGIAPASPLDELGPTVLLVLLGLGTLALLWYGRDRPVMPPDFRVRLAPEGAVGEPEPLEPSSPVRAILGLTPRHPISLGANGRVVGAIEPVAGELYRLRLTDGATLGAASGPPPAALASQVYLVASGATYTLGTAEGPFRLQFGFRPPRPPP